MSFLGGLLVCVGVVAAFVVGVFAVVAAVIAAVAVVGTVRVAHVCNCWKRSARKEGSNWGAKLEPKRLRKLGYTHTHTHQEQNTKRGDRIGPRNRQRAFADAPRKRHDGQLKKAQRPIKARRPSEKAP